jgi:hypothetical protein
MAETRKPIAIEDIIADDADNDSARPPKASKAAPKKQRLEVPFTQFRNHWLPMLQRMRARSALPLLIAIAYQLDMDRTVRTAITKKTWARLGDCTKDERKTMLRALGRVPDIVRLEFRLRSGPKYAAHKGKWFDRAPPRLVRMKED